MSCESIATTGWPLLPSDRMLKKPFGFWEYFGTPKTGSHNWTAPSDHLLKIKEIQALLFWMIQQAVPHRGLNGVGYHDLKASSLQVAHQRDD